MLRLRQIALVATDRDAVVDQLRAELGVEVAFNDPGVGVFGLHNAVMPVGNQFVEVVAPIKEGTAAGRYLDRRKGDGGYMVILQCGDDHAARKARLGDELGVRFALAQDGKEYHILQLHPADTGGSFLEVDQQIGGEDMDTGPWEPAGHDWQRARQTDKVNGITSAIIQTDDPARLAARWADLLELDVTDDGKLTLDNATIEFVEATDGRGEGLAALRLAGVDSRELDICGMHITIEAAPGA